MKKYISSIHRTISLSVLTATALLGFTVSAQAAFVSGSACAVSTDPKCLGAFTSSLANQVIDLPPDGILNYTTFTVQGGHTVSFKKNAANTPVVILTSGDVNISGVLSVNAQTAPTHSGTAGDGVLGDDGQPGTGGPGGFDGGSGGLGPVLGGTNLMGGAGKGPGGGGAATGRYGDGRGYAGSGGGFNGSGTNGDSGSGGGAAYGQWSLLPLIGGSGGGGGAAGWTFSGGAGGGGGGAILIASSTTIYIAGTIYANGYWGSQSQGTYCGGGGGGGAGGAIRLVAESLSRGGSGTLYANGGTGGASCGFYGGAGSNGYIRLESNKLTGWTTGNSSPGYSYTLPGKVFVPKNPSLTIAGISTSGGTTQAVPANPTGVADVTLPQGTTTATVQLTGANIPVGTTVTVYVVPSVGANRTSSLSTALDGASDAATTATATVTLKDGNNVLLASATYTVTELVAMNLPKFGGEYVAKIRVDSDMAGASKVTYITASGKEYPADGAAVKAAS
jgi:hypothetical protein